MDNDTLKNNYVYRKFIGKKKRQGMGMIAFAAFSIILLFMGKHSITMSIATFILSAALVLAGVLMIRMASDQPEMIETGHIWDIIKISRQTGQEAKKGEAGFDNIKYRPEWRFAVECGDPKKLVMARRTETLMSDTYDIKNDDIEKGMSVVVFRYGNKDYMILCPDYDDGVDM